MKPTPTQWLLPLASLIFIVMTLHGCWRPARRTIEEGTNRPVLTIAKVTAGHLRPYPGREHIPWESPFLEVSFRNEGKTAALLTAAEARVDALTGGCDLRLLFGNEKVSMNILIPPGHEDHALIGVKVRVPCKAGGLIKLTVAYTNVDSGVKYTQDLQAAIRLSFGDDPAEQK